MLDAEVNERFRFGVLLLGSLGIAAVTWNSIEGGLFDGTHRVPNTRYVFIYTADEPDFGNKLSVKLEAWGYMHVFIVNAEHLPTDELQMRRLPIGEDW